MNVGALLAGTLVYLASGRAVVRFTTGTTRDILFALLNVSAVYALFYPIGGLGSTAAFVGYVGLVVIQFAVLHAAARGPAWMSVAAFATPVAALVVLQSVPYVVPASFTLPGGSTAAALVNTMIGLSYLAFRTSYLALEVRNGAVPRPTLWQYLGFAFFAPTMAVGPINRYSGFRRGVTGGGRSAAPLARAMLRLLVGAVKYRFLGGILKQLSYSGLLLDGHPHHWMDLGVASVAYYLYLYCNFSGFCDMAIGASGIMGISVEENFRNPFAARNVRDFWNRWHITLSVYMRDVVFTPLSKALTARFGIQNAAHAAAAAIGLVFILIGLWHGPGWNFLAFGAMHAAGVVGTHYYTIWLKRRLGRDGFAAYNRSPVVRAVAVSATFVFVTASFFLFANSFGFMQAILGTLRWQ